MCIGFNYLAIKNKTEPYFDDLNSGHENLIKQNKLTDGNLFTRMFVRIEVIPVGKEFTSTNVADWEFRVDEQGSLPGWFEEEKETWRARCVDAAIKQIQNIIKTGAFKGSFNFRGSKITSESLPEWVRAKAIF